MRLTRRLPTILVLCGAALARRAPLRRPSRARFQTKAYYLADGAECDVLRPEVLERLHVEVDRAWADFVFASPPCRTYSIARCEWLR